MEKTSPLTAIKDKAIGVDSLGAKKNKNGNYVARRGYYYRPKSEPADMAKNIKAAADELGIKIEIVSSGDIWKAFRGGASLANQSHYYVEFKLIESANITAGELAKRNIKVVLKDGTNVTADLVKAPEMKLIIVKETTKIITVDFDHSDRAKHTLKKHL